ncbi:MAG: hypothetical protein HYW07_21510 [Candidatus Latescibacteria bacterium]|nr:hypothetical protein [Candidatus Latescibacterota bacterium]
MKQLTRAGRVKLGVFNVLGQQVRVLVEGVQEPGAYQLVWDGRDQGGTAVATGIYFYRLEAGAFSAVQRTALVR